MSATIRIDAEKAMEHAEAHLLDGIKKTTEYIKQLVEAGYLEDEPPLVSWTAPVLPPGISVRVYKTGEISAQYRLKGKNIYWADPCNDMWARPLRASFEPHERILIYVSLLRALVYVASFIED